MANLIRRLEFHVLAYDASEFCEELSLALAELLRVEKGLHVNFRVVRGHPTVELYGLMTLISRISPMLDTLRSHGHRVSLETFSEIPYPRSKDDHGVSEKGVRPKFRLEGGIWRLTYLLG